jgi:hypothetical protein
LLKIAGAHAVSTGIPAQIFFWDIVVTRADGFEDGEDALLLGVLLLLQLSL